ncbi:MAG: GntR family transcriptional regulator [Hymenobacter sp.]|nr:MAG: GntR family transcriptional regulator [Hymenobacter sp.]
MYQLQFNPAAMTHKSTQIVQSIVADIERGTLRHGERLPSLCQLSTEYEVGRDTVERAYRTLKAQGHCTSRQGSGYYVQAPAPAKLRVLLIFNTLSSCNKEVYYAFLEALGDQAKVDLQIHHYSSRCLRQILEQNLGHYNCYVVMPHFAPAEKLADCQAALTLVPASQLVLLDKNMPSLAANCLRVFQDFNRDIFAALEDLRDLLAKYQRLVLVLPNGQNSYPDEISWGFRTFCLMHQLVYAVQCSDARETPRCATAYITVETTDLAELIKEARHQAYILGADIGLLSFNETPLKELLDITVITTDFEAMGRTTAQLLLAKKQVTVRNPFYTIRRTSL